MKASEAIARLQTLIHEYGDREIGNWNNTESEFDQTDNIEAYIVQSWQRQSFDGVFFGIADYVVGGHLGETEQEKK